MTNLTFKEELERSEKERKTGKKIKDDFCFWDYSFFYMDAN